jgi:hypothetical protein
MTMTAAVPSTRRASRAGVAVGVVTFLAMCCVGLGLWDAAQPWSPPMAGVPVKFTAGAPALQGTSVVPSVEGLPSPDGGFGAPAASPDVWPGGKALPLQPAGSSSHFEMTVPRTDVTSKYFADAEHWACLLAGGVVALVLIPAVRGVAAGELFARGHARRLGAAAAVGLLGWAAGAALPWWAASRVIASGMSGVPSGWIAPDFNPALWQLVVVALLAVLAEATRRGAKLAADTDGLV